MSTIINPHILGPNIPNLLWKGIGLLRDGHVAEDTATLNLSWYYDWVNRASLIPEPWEAGATGVQYVPMMWGDWELYEEPAPADSLFGSNVMLGFNEPDIASQSNITVARALELWPAMEAAGVRLGSPAVSTEFDALDWLHAFMTGNGGSYIPRVDFICVHWYENWSPMPLDELLDELHTTYGLPIWITEIGNAISGPSGNATLISQVMDILSTRPWVERIAWFMGREPAGSEYPGTGLIDPDGDITSAGVVYAALDAKIDFSEPVLTVPDTPTGLIAVGLDGEVSLTWTAPVDDGGSAITDYEVQWRTTAGPGSWNTFSDGVGTTMNATVTGLTNGTSYDFQVRAVNSVGAGAYSAIDTATPEASATVPGAPTGLDATAGDGEVDLVWTAPASNGGSAITDYEVQWRTTAGPGSWNTFSDGTSTATTATVTGLTNGTSYDFQVRAVNSVGAGAYSTTDTATPVASGPLSFNDPFTRSDGPIGSDYESVGGNSLPVIDNNAIRAGSGGWALYACRHVQGLTTDHAVEIVFETLPLDCGADLMLRVDSSGNGYDGFVYCYDVGAGPQISMNVGRLDALTFVPIGTEISIARPALPFTFRVEIEGNVLRHYVNGVLQLSGADTANTYTTETHVGIQLYGDTSVARITEMSGEEI